MYENFFSLSKAPFSVVPDPDCTYLTTQHADAISGLAYGVLERKGYLALTAEAGLGKTTALRVLERLLAESDVLSSVISVPRLNSSEFLELAMLNFGFREVPSSKAQRLKRLEEFLIDANAEGKIAALIVDEAHEMSADLLEEIRLLGNFESSEQKLLQIVLVGQNQLNDHLNAPELWQLKQRITLRLSLGRLDREAVEAYINFRWDYAGGSLPTPFSLAALDAIAAWSQGVPRLVNVICDNALLIAFSESNRSVDVQSVREACEELLLPMSPIARAPSFKGARPAALPAEQAGPGITDEPANGTAPNSWVAARPALWKRWRGFTHSQKNGRLKTGILLLKEP
ncbi:MAG TPA: AAA family ATPase [Bryobacteraceae bacterium]|nr:AAA family ATPase [Bryobacteraceae bacterium]